MKKNYKKNQILKYVVIFAFVMSSFEAFAQGQIIVNSPPNLSGVKFDVINATFGSQGDILETEVVFESTNGCLSVSGVDGKIALLDRGDCAFTEKCKKAQIAGAVAVIICNSNATNNWNPVPGLGLPELMTGDDASITIPCYMASTDDCEQIKVEIDNVKLTIKQTSNCDFSDLVYPSNIIWGSESGEGDFAGGLNGWESNKDIDKGWQWSENGDLTKGSYNSRVLFIDSKTACNGALVFDSDYYDTGGNGTSGTCPAPCIGAIYSPVIDLSESGATAVFIQFTQNLRQYSSTFSIVYSSDGGTIWDTISINRDYPSNSDPIRGDIVKLALCGADPTTTSFKFGFLYSGYYYYWAIDDVMLLGESHPSIDIAKEWFATAPEYYIPSSQLKGKKMPFMTDIRNIGDIAATDVSIRATITNPVGDEVYNGVLDYGVVSGCSTWENRVSADFIYDMGTDTMQGKYTINYTLLSTNDATPDDNVLTANYYVTKDVISKAPTEAEVGYNYMSSYGYPWNGKGIYYNLGNCYYLPKGSIYSNEGYEISATFGVTSENSNYVISGYVTASLYKWENKSDPIDENGSGRVTMENDERILLSQAEAVYVDNDTDNRLIKVIFDEEEYTGSLNLEDDSYYLVSIDVAPDSGSDNIYMLAADKKIAPEFNYHATNSAAYSLEILNNTPAFISVGSEGDIEERDFDVSASTRIAVIPLSFRNILAITDINRDIKVAISPNPAGEYVGIQLDLNKISKNVNIELMSIDGKKVKSQNFYNIKTDILHVKVDDISNGVYMVNIKTDEGFISKRMVIQR